MADDTISVALVAETAGFKAAMSDAAASTSQFGNNMADAGTKGESMLTALAGGKRQGEARELRMVAMELGSLEGAGAMAGRGMFTALSAARAFNAGLTTMGGAIGIVVAAVGLAVTAYSYLAGATKKASDAQDKLNEGTVKWVTGLSDLNGVIEDNDLPGWLRDTAKNANAAADSLSAFKLDPTEAVRSLNEQVSKVRGEWDKGNISLTDAATKIKALTLQIAAVEHGFSSWDAMVKKLSDDIKAQAALEAKLTLTGAQADVNRIAILEKYDKLQQEVADHTIKNNEQIANSISSTLLSAAKSNENFLKATQKAIIDWAERLLAQRAVLIAISFATGGAAGVGALFSGGLGSFLSGNFSPVPGATPGAAGTTSAASFSQVAAGAAARTGNKNLGPAY